jgi:hypothetical protein
MSIQIKTAGTYKLVYNVWHKVAGTWVKLPTIHYKFGGIWKLVHTGQEPYLFNYTISTNTNNFNMRAAAIAAGWNGVQALQATITINSGVTVGSVTTAGFAFNSGLTFPEGTSLKVINNGIIAGLGGTGANSSFMLFADAMAGGIGGSALFTAIPTTLTNNGSIYAGGGGGGGGQMFTSSTYGEIYRGAAGGGGRGGGTSLGGISDTADSGAPDDQVWRILATGGTFSTSGQPSTYDGGGSETGYSYAGGGGVGGLLASSGQAGLLCEVSGVTVPPNGGTVGALRFSKAGAGGIAGKAISGTSNITYLTYGTIVGAID